MNAPEGTPIVREFAEKVRERLGGTVVAIHWFGSRVRGEGTADSDFDLLLETTDTLTYEQRDAVADIAVDLSADYGVLLDIHQRTSEAMNRGYPVSLFVQSVKEEAVAI